MIVLILVLVLVLVGLSLSLGLGIGSGQPGGAMFPFDNPFKTQFNKFVPVLYRVYTPSILHQPLVIHCIQTYQPATTDLDFTIDTEVGIRSALGSARDWRFVCSLYKASLLLISPDAQVTGIGIATNNNSCYQMVRGMGLDIKLLDREAIISGYGSSYAIYADLSGKGESDMIKTLSKVPSHLVPIPSGIGLEQGQAPRISLDDIRRQYPLLTISHGLELYYTTRQSPYVMLAHQRVPGDKVSQVLGCLLYLMHTYEQPVNAWSGPEQQERNKVTKLMKGLAPVDINHCTLPIPVHPGALAIYRKVIDPMFHAASQM
jgi:hypothetical protein